MTTSTNLKKVKVQAKVVIEEEEAKTEVVMARVVVTVEDVDGVIVEDMVVRGDFSPVLTNLSYLLQNPDQLI